MHAHTSSAAPAPNRAQYVKWPAAGRPNVAEVGGSAPQTPARGVFSPLREREWSPPPAPAPGTPPSEERAQQRGQVALSPSEEQPQGRGQVALSPKEALDAYARMPLNSPPAAHRNCGRNTVHALQLAPAGQPQSAARPPQRQSQQAQWSPQQEQWQATPPAPAPAAQPQPAPAAARLQPQQAQWSPQQEQWQATPPAPAPVAQPQPAPVAARPQPQQAQWSPQPQQWQPQPTEQQWQATPPAPAPAAQPQPPPAAARPQPQQAQWQPQQAQWQPQQAQWQPQQAQWQPQPSEQQWTATPPAPAPAAQPQPAPVAARPQPQQAQWSPQPQQWQPQPSEQQWTAMPPAAQPQPPPAAAQPQPDDSWVHDPNVGCGEMSKAAMEDYFGEDVTAPEPEPAPQPGSMFDRFAFHGAEVAATPKPAPRPAAKVNNTATRPNKKKRKAQAQPKTQVKTQTQPKTQTITQSTTVVAAPTGPVHKQLQVAAASPQERRADRKAGRQQSTLTQQPKPKRARPRRHRVDPRDAPRRVREAGGVDPADSADATAAFNAAVDASCLTVVGMLWADLLTNTSLPQPPKPQSREAKNPDPDWVDKPAIAATVSVWSSPSAGVVHYVLPLSDAEGSEARWALLLRVLASERPTVVFAAQRVLVSAMRHCGGTPVVRALRDPKVAAFVEDTRRGDDFEAGLTFEAVARAFLEAPWKRRAEWTEGCGLPRPQGVVHRALTQMQLDAQQVAMLDFALSEQRLVEARCATTVAELEMPLVVALAAMEARGTPVEPEALAQWVAPVQQRCRELEAEARTLNGGQEFNLASPDEVAAVMYDRLKLRAPKLGLRGKRDGGDKRSTKKEVLQALAAQGHRFPQLMLDHRKLSKMLSTYLRPEALPKHFTAARRMHAHWNQTVASTGRLSSHGPNFQNLPKPGAGRARAGVTVDELRARINVRDVVRPHDPARVVLAVDYSQIEIRVLAHLSEDEALRALFRDRGSDIYKRMAAQALRKREAQISDEERARFKVVVVGLMYGMGDSNAAFQLNVPKAEAQRLKKAFHRAFPRVAGYMDRIKEYARAHGFVRTITGRRRMLPDAQGRVGAKRKADAERQAFNTVIQGSGADLMKVGLVLVERGCAAWPGAPLVLAQVHDEIVLSCAGDQVPAVAAHLQRTLEEETPLELSRIVQAYMPGAPAFGVPLKVTVEVGDSWGTVEDYC